MKPLVVATVADATGLMEATFFNQPWLERHYRPGTRLMLTGKYQSRGRFRVEHHAPTEAVTAIGDTTATYPATKGITSTQILALVREHLAAAHEVPELLPTRLRAAEGLPSAPPRCDRRARRRPRGRAAQAGVRRAAARPGGPAAPARRAPLDHARRAADRPADAEPRVAHRAAAVRADPDQLAAIAEIDADLALDRPMQRLLMGEVGSGKTVVALHAMLRAVEHGRQAALMAPTETLAEQHFATLQTLMPGALVPAALLTGSTAAGRRADTLGKLASGELPLIVGTHALIEDTVVFADLAVAVVDEQHRFGVRQRTALDAKAAAGPGPARAAHDRDADPPDAALASFGALDVTALRGLPRGRQPIETHVASGERERERAYERLREELRAGRQAFVVCPLVERVRGAAGPRGHGRVRAAARDGARGLRGRAAARPDAAAREGRGDGALRGGEADVLVATTVIEVGIDVPNATVMLVEDAERYGISQLHQLRGRVGRGEHASLCLLFGPKESRRLQALAQNGDGFALAEIDLELRGEGELTGTRQSGMARFRVARLPEDADVLERAHTCASEVLRHLTSPSTPCSAEELLRVEASPVAA